MPQAFPLIGVWIEGEDRKHKRVLSTANLPGARRTMFSYAERMVLDGACRRASVRTFVLVPYGEPEPQEVLDIIEPGDAELKALLAGFLAS